MPAPTHKLTRSRKDIILVLLQLVLFGLFFLLPEGATFQWGYVTHIVGAGFSLVGLALVLRAFYQMGSSLSPFPTPRTHGILITTGIFAWIRHPIYSGLMAFVGGLALSTAALTKMIMAVMILIFFYVKSVYEEGRLLQKFPDYKVYSASTGRFFPTLRFPGTKKF